jgi:hypothetical protein
MGGFTGMPQTPQVGATIREASLSETSLAEPPPSEAPFKVDADFEFDESLAAQVAEINAEASAPPPPENREGIFARFTKKRAPASSVVTETESVSTDAALHEADLAEASLADASFDADLVAEAMGEKPPAPDPREKKKRFISPVTAGWAALLLFLALVGGLFFFARDTVTSVLPGAGGLVDTQGLAFEGVRYDWTSDGNQTVLEVQGNVRNVSDATMTVPTVIIALRDENGEEISEWTTEVGDNQLEAGKEVPFTTQIPSPPSNVRSLKVRFAKAE